MDTDQIEHTNSEVKQNTSPANGFKEEFLNGKMNGNEKFLNGRNEEILYAKINENQELLNSKNQDLLNGRNEELIFGKMNGKEDLLNGSPVLNGIKDEFLNGRKEDFLNGKKEDFQNSRKEDFQNGRKEDLLNGSLDCDEIKITLEEEDSLEQLSGIDIVKDGPAILSKLELVFPKDSHDQFAYGLSGGGSCVYFLLPIL